MVWPFNRNNNKQDNTDSTETNKPIFLEDIPPKFPPQGQEQTQAPSQLQSPQSQGETFSTSQEIRNYIHTLKFSDFGLSNLVTIPCFREAGLSGFSCFFVFSSVLFFYHKNFRKSVNWGFGGLLLGSVFGWEHCNNSRRQSQMAVKLAQERFESKSKKDT